MTQAQTAIQALQTAINALVPIAKQDTPAGLHAASAIGHLLAIQLDTSWGDNSDVDSQYE